MSGIATNENEPSGAAEINSAVSCDITGGFEMLLPDRSQPEIERTPTMINDEQNRTIRCNGIVKQSFLYFTIFRIILLKTRDLPFNRLINMVLFVRLRQS